MWPQAKEHLKLEGQEEPRIFKPSEVAGPGWQLGFGALASRTMRESIPVVLSHPVGGNSSWQPQKTNVACKTHYWLITILIPASNSHCHLAHDIKPTFYLQTRRNFYKRHGGNLLSPPNNNNNNKKNMRERERKKWKPPKYLPVGKQTMDKPTAEYYRVIFFKWMRQLYSSGYEKAPRHTVGCKECDTQCNALCFPTQPCKKKKSFAFCSQVSVYEGRYKVLDEKNKMIKHSSFREEGWNCGLICKVLGGCIQALFRFAFKF